MNKDLFTRLPLEPNRMTMKENPRIAEAKMNPPSNTSAVTGVLFEGYKVGPSLVLNASYMVDKYQTYML